MTNIIQDIQQAITKVKAHISYLENIGDETNTYIDLCCSQAELKGLQTALEIVMTKLPG